MKSVNINIEHINDRVTRDNYYLNSFISFRRVVKSNAKANQRHLIKADEKCK